MSLKRFFSRPDISNELVTSRRHLLKMGLAASAMMTIHPAWAFQSKHPERKLSFYGLHTGEKISTLYWQDGHYIPEALTDISQLLRDHRSNETHPIDTTLLDLLYHLRTSVGSNKPFDVISGYRSPSTNAMLHQNSNGVAKRSMHMLGRAIDIRLPDKQLSSLHQAALSLQSGGVGYYPESNFVHVDTGRIRRW